MFHKFIAAFVLSFFLMSSTVSAEDFKEGYDWDKGLLIVKGTGFIQPALFTRGQYFAKNFARQTARILALAELAEWIPDYNGKSNTKFKSSRSKLKATLSHKSPPFQIIEKGARQIGDAVFSDDDFACEVYMAVPLFGENSVAQISYFNLKNKTKKDFPKPAIPANISENYTGLIVDCRGFEVYRDFTVVISYSVTEKKSRHIYGPEYIDFNKIGETLINQGMVSYVKDIKDATRAGKNPLVVKADHCSNFIGYAGVSANDANLILNANKKSGFLDRCAVVFLCDKFD